MLNIGLFSTDRYRIGSLPAALTDYHNTRMRTHLIKYGFEQKEVAYLEIFKVVEDSKFAICLGMFERSATRRR